jgi:SAM-dependent methyltransferase
LFLHRCRACACEFSWPQPSADWLAEIYADYPSIRNSGEAKPRREFFRQLLLASEIDLDGCSVLEIGGGEGDCSAAIRAHWPSAALTSVEPHTNTRSVAGDNPSIIATSVEAWLAKRKEPASMDASALPHAAGPPESTFDVVLAFDVLEHLRDPARVLEGICADALRSGGHLIASFPNVQSLTQRVLGRNWVQYKPEHLFYFSRAAVEQMGERAGLRTRDLKPLSKRLSLAYFLAVGSRSGPPLLQQMSRSVSAALPGDFARRRLALRTGEWLWIATKTGS